jgi:hypothetical protein
LLSQREADQREYCDYRIDYAFHVLASLHCFFFGISGVEVAKTVPEQDIRGGIWLIGWLCERAFRSRVALRKEGQVELLRRRLTDLARCDIAKFAKTLSTGFYRALLRSTPQSQNDIELMQ